MSSEVKLGAKVEDQIDAVVRANSAGIRTSITVIIGLGGRKMYHQHAINTGKAVTAMNPTYFSALTLMVVPYSPLDAMVKSGSFELITDPVEILGELELMIQHTNAPGPVIFRTNHASNYLPLKGTLPQDKAALLQLVRAAQKDPTLLRAESWRGL